MGGDEQTAPQSVGVQVVSSVEITVEITAEITVFDMDQVIEFYTTVLDFETISNVEVAGRPYELLQGIFGVRMRVIGMQLGQERIELTQYLTPQGRPIPVDFRSIAMKIASRVH